jgi:hypothetical protein
MAQHEFEAFYHCAVTSDRIGAHTDTDHTVPYGTGLWGRRCPRHFVPGYGRTVPRDISQQALTSDHKYLRICDLCQELASVLNAD